MITIVIRLRSDYNISRTPASIQRDSTWAKNERQFFVVSQSNASWYRHIIVESQLWYRLYLLLVLYLQKISRLNKNQVYVWNMFDSNKEREREGWTVWVAAARIATSQQSSAVMDDCAYDSCYCKGISSNCYL